MVNFDTTKPNHYEMNTFKDWQDQVLFFDLEEVGRCKFRNHIFEHITISDVEAYSKQDVLSQTQNDINTINFCTTLSGSLHEIQPQQFTLNRGECNFGFQANTLSEHWVSANTNFHMLHLVIKLDFLNSILNTDEAWKRLLISNIEKNTTFLAFDNGVPITSCMQNIIFDIRNHYFQGDIGKLYVESKTLDLIQLNLNLLKTRINKDLQVKINEKDKQKLKDLKKFIDAHYLEDWLSLTILCREFGLNEFKLKKGFKELFNTTVFGYILDLKMQQAKQLLYDGIMNVNDVSDYLGYSHPGHFSKAFKKKYGILPSSIKGEANAAFLKELTF